MQKENQLQILIKEKEGLIIGEQNCNQNFKVIKLLNEPGDSMKASVSKELIYVT